MNLIKKTTSYILLIYITFFLNLLIGFIYFEKNFEKNKNNINYSKTIEELNIKKGQIIYILLDSFTENKKWHGELVEGTLKANLNIINKDLKLKKKDIKIIKLNILDGINHSKILKNGKEINTYLFLKELRKKYKNNKIGLNQSFINSNILSDLYFEKKITELNIFVSVTAGNFGTQEDLTLIEEIKYNFTKVLAFLKQYVFFTVLKDNINKEYIHFNLNYDNGKKYTSIIRNKINIEKEKNNLKNNLLFFVKKNRDYYYISNAKSTSEATPIGLNYMLFKKILKINN